MSNSSVLRASHLLVDLNVYVFQFDSCELFCKRVEFRLPAYSYFCIHGNLFNNHCSWRTVTLSQLLKKPHD